MHVYVYIHMYTDPCKKETQVNICSLVHHLYFQPPQKIQVAEGAYYFLVSPQQHCTVTLKASRADKHVQEKSSTLLLKATVLLITWSQVFSNSKLSRQPSEEGSLTLPCETIAGLLTVL